MNIHRIENVLKQIEENKNYKDFTRLLSYEERKKLLHFLTESEENDDFSYNYPVVNDDDLFINFFTEEEAKDIYSNDFYKLNDNFKSVLMCNLSPNQAKEAFKEYIPDEEVVRYVLIKLSSDEERIEFVEKHLQNLSNHEKITALALSLDSDKLKLEYLDRIIDEYDKVRVLKSIKDDMLKLQHLYTIKSDYMKTDIIASVKDDKIKKQYLNSYSNNDDAKLNIIASLEDNELKLQYLDSLTTEKAKSQLIIRTGDDNLKIQYLSIFQDEYIKSNVISTLRDDKLKLQYLESIKYIYAKANIIASLKDNKLILEHLKNLPDDEVKKWIIENIRDLKTKTEALIFLDDLTSYCINADWLNKVKNINDDIHKEIIKKIAQENNLNYDNLLRIFLKFGYSIKNIGNNLSKIVNLKPDEFEKIIQIIDIGKKSKLTMTDVKDISETLYEREYRINNRADLLIFSRLQHSISNKNKNEILNILSKINEIIDINNILKENNINPNTFIESLLENKNIDVLHIITDKYLDKKRELYKIEKRKTITNELNLDYDFDKKYLLSKLFQKYDVNYIYYFIKNEIIENKLLDDNQKELLNNESLFIECLKFKKDEEHYPKEDFSKIKSKLRALNGILNILYDEKRLDFLGDRREENAIILKPKEVISSDYIRLLNELDIDILKDKLLSNPLIYEKLINILTKHKFMSWSNTFENLLKNADLTFNEGELATLINYFYDFYPKLEEQQNKLKKDIRLSNILDELRTYGSCSIKYSYLLGKEDSELIISNPGPNSSGLKVEERLKKIPDEILIQYKRKYITVHPMNENISLKNGKKIHVNIGDTTSPINLTYGERTGACMRIGGIGNSLFDFCLENENGFHIRLTNPTTGEFVSRVSGFRNGNTVFLNQLRNSLDKSISNSDLIEAIDIIAKKIVELTKESKYPIKNVIISDGYVMEEREDNKTILEHDVKEGYEHFYSDVSNFNAIYLEKNDEIELGPEKAEKYDVSRKKIVCFENMKDIIEQMQKFNLINGLLKGESLGNISLISEDAIMNIGKIYVGEDFLLAYDYEGNLITKLILDREEHFKEKANSETNTLINFLNENSIENERGKTR